MFGWGPITATDFDLRGSARSVAGFGTAAVLALGLGYLSGGDALYAVAAALAVFLVGLVAIDLSLIPAGAFLGMLLLLRVGGGSGLSVSDLVLFVATFCALPLLRTGESPELRRLLWCVVTYQAALLPTVVHFPYQSDIIEWIHEAFLVGGSLIVGWVVGRRGRARGALTAFLLACAGIGIWAALTALTNGFQPVYLPTLHKNAIGDLLAVAAVVAYARPEWLGRSRRWTNTIVMLCLFGVLASQAKQGMISAAVGIFCVALRGNSIGRRSKLLLAAIIPGVVIAAVVVSSELQSTNQFNSVHQRLTWFEQSLQVWHHSPWLGVGLRWWYTSRFSATFQPPNAELEMLTSAGIVGLLVFLTTIVAALWTLLRVDARFGTVAVAVILTRLVQGQMDLYWVAAQSSVPWLIAGTALGVQALRRYEKCGLSEDSADLTRPRIRSAIRAETARARRQDARSIRPAPPPHHSTHA
ncbi:MAG: O-antigen ligase family protein, partial [Mycobacterium sp.]|nr:O-antigen ligase family protein [Mycobacterium sp.]